jgi:hypothetical protein
MRARAVLAFSPMRARAVLAFSVVGALAGCDQLLGIEPWDASASASSSSSSSGAGGGGGVCATGDACLTIPLSWKGPVALTDPGGECGGAFSNEVDRGKTDIVGAHAKCSCDCTPAHGEVCAASTVHVFSDGACTPPSSVSLQLTNGCAAGLSGPPLGANSISVSAAAPTGGSCDPVESTNVPPPTFDERRLCAPAGRGASCEGGGICAATPGAGLMPRLCVFTAGLADACPGDFTERFDLYRGPLADTRACAGCSCSASDGTCVAFVNVYADGNCVNVKDQVSNDMFCGSTAGGFASAMAAYAVNVGQCAPTNAKPIGKLEGTNPVTVCCTNPLGQAATN